MSKSPAAATRRQVGKRSTHMLQEKVGVKSSETSSRKTLLEKDVLFDKETVDLEPEVSAMKRQRMNQQEGQAANLSRSPQAGNVTNCIRTHSHGSHSNDQHCTTTNNQSNQMDQAVSSLNVSHESDESVGDANPMAGFTSIVGGFENTPQPMMLRSNTIHENMPGNPSTSRNDGDDVIYCSRCFFWSRTPESFHEHLYQCDKRLSCSACGFRGTRMDVLDHIRECVTGESAASCINLNFAIPDNKFDDLRQPIPGRGFLQYGFAQEIKKEPKNNLVQVWKPMDAIVDMNSANHVNRFEEEAFNLQKQKDALQIEMEVSFRRIGEIEKVLSEKSSHYNKLKIKVANMKKNASNEDQLKEMKLAAQNLLITEKLKKAASLKEEAESAQSTLLEEVKVLNVKHYRSHSKETARALQEAEKKLNHLKLEIEEKNKNWSILFVEANTVSRQLNEAVKATANNIDCLFFLNNSLTELSSEIDRLKEEIDDLKSSIPKLLQFRFRLNEALLEISQKKKSAELRQQEVDCLEDLCRKFGYLQ